MNQAVPKVLVEAAAAVPNVDNVSIDRSGRLLSSFGDTILRIDTSPAGDGSTLWTRDLSTVNLSMWGAPAHVRTTIPLLSVRFAANWAYIAVASELERTSVPTRLSQRTSGAFNTFHRFVVWHARRGVTNLSTVSRADTDQLLSELIANGSWAPLIGHAEAYHGLLKGVLAAADPILVTESFTTSRWNTFSFSEGRLTDLLGFPVHCTQIPSAFVNGISAVLKKSRPSDSRGPISEALARRTLRGILTQVNNLARVGDLADGRFGLSFVPYSNPRKLAIQGVRRQPDSFQNMALEEVIALLRECRVWVEDYAAGIIRFYAELGEKLATLLKVSPANASHSLSQYVREISPRYEEEFGLPAIKFPWVRQGSSRTMLDLVRTLQTACAVMVLVNHGRRHNEILGELPLSYGLYEGCLTCHEESGIQRFELRVYIEKTLRDWANMSANASVARAITVLQDLLDAGRKIAEHLRSADHALRTTSEGRAQLFQVVPLAAKGCDRQPAYYVWHDHSRWLFERAGLDPKLSDNRMHPFRRMFAQIYYYRYENADIRALSQWLGHASIANTLTYVTDPASRENAERIETLHRRSNEWTVADVRAFGREYLNDCLLRLSEGLPSGGGFTALAIKVFRAMSGRATFPSDTAERAKTLSAWFIERGYEPEPYTHSACFAGKNTLSKSKSKCFDPVRKQLNKHEASPAKCSGCPHAYVNSGYIDSDREEIGRLEQIACDAVLPQPARDQAKTAVTTLRGIIDIELKLQGGNQEKLKSIYGQLAALLEAPDA